MDRNPSPDFLIVSSGYNCAKYVRLCYQSVKAQTYKNFKAVFLDDGSSQETKNALALLNNEDQRIRIYLSDVNMGAAYRRMQAIKNFAAEITPETVIVLLGMDDMLMPNALERIAKEYAKGAWMTYGNWMDNNGFILDIKSLYFANEVHEARSYRKVAYRSTALNTFKRFLFDNMTEDDFKFEGEWIKSTTESNLMLSCLEMCGKDRIGVIEDYIMLYNRRQDSAINRNGKSYQQMIYNDVMKRPKKPLYESTECMRK